MSDFCVQSSFISKPIKSCLLTDNAGCAPDSGKDDKVCDKDVLKQVGPHAFVFFLPFLPSLDFIVPYFLSSPCLYSRCCRLERRFAWIGTATV